ncbi:MAG TPA: hypothetical protein VMT30_04770 [Candidatus Saccharimonadia bacterium]|nr:hypothetical protein [Candidatus Saccharimonadia bacterium]
MLRKIVLIGTPLCALAGFVLAAPGRPAQWLPGTFDVVMLFGLLGVVPLLLAQGVVALAARRRRRRLPVNDIWGPGLYYLPLAGFSGYLLGSAYGVAARGGSGAEYLPLVLGVLWFYSFGVVMVAAVVSGLVALRRHRRRSLRR